MPSMGPTNDSKKSNSKTSSSSLSVTNLIIITLSVIILFLCIVGGGAFYYLKVRIETNKENVAYTNKEITESRMSPVINFNYGSNNDLLGPGGKNDEMQKCIFTHINIYIRIRGREKILEIKTFFCITH